ncbi:hypothetical protein OROHE_012232 [Orobanche hederae]
MDSICQHHSDSDRILSASICSKTRCRGSTSQMCLLKILTTITTVPPPVSAANPLFPGTQTKESSSGSGFDTNVGFCVSPEPKEPIGAGASSLSLTNANAGEGGFVSLEMNLDSGGGDRVETNEEHGNGVVLENPHSTDIEKTGESLSLLIEAAELVLGEFKTEDDNVLRCYELKKDESTAEIERDGRNLRRRSSGSTTPELSGKFEGTTSSPVVRSKRGRAQILPCKYRDSVLEPLTRWSKRR